MMRRASLLHMAWAGLLVACLGGCANPIVAKVTNFNAWKPELVGSTFNFVPVENKDAELEQGTYEDYVRAELERVGLRRVPDGQPARLTVEVKTTSAAEQRKVLQPIYQTPQVYVPPVRDIQGNVIPGYWINDQFGARYVGDREVTRSTQISRLRVRVMDTQPDANSRRRTVFEATAVNEGERENLVEMVPYLVRAMFMDFPGANGRVRTIRFDEKNGAVTR